MSEKETSTVCCKHCGQTKTRIYAGKYPDNINKRWVDEAGLEWNGHVCSTCHVEKVNARKKLGKKNSYL